MKVRGCVCESKKLYIRLLLRAIHLTGFAEKRVESDGVCVQRMSDVVVVVDVFWKWLVLTMGVFGEKWYGMDDGYLTGIAGIGWQKLGVV